MKVPWFPRGDLARLTKDLLTCGADIVEMNTLRKRLSAVKGGKFVQLCAPAQVYAIVLLTFWAIPGYDRLRPCLSRQLYQGRCLGRCGKIQPLLTDEMKALLDVETPKQLDNVETVITGSVRELCAAAAQACRQLGMSHRSD